MKLSRRTVGACLLLVLAVGLGSLALLGPHRTPDGPIPISEGEPAGSDSSTGAPHQVETEPVGMQGAYAGARTVSGTVLVTTSDGAALKVIVDAGSTPTTLAEVAVLITGEETSVTVPANVRSWAVIKWPANKPPNYLPAIAETSVREGFRMVFRLEAARGCLQVRALDQDGVAFAGVPLRVEGATEETQSTNRLGFADFNGLVPGRGYPIKFLEHPPGARVVRVSEASWDSVAGGDGQASAMVHLIRTAGFDAHLEGNHAGISVELSDGENFSPIVGYDRGICRWTGGGRDRPGVLQGRGYDPGQYRLNVLGMDGSLRSIVFDLSAGQVLEIESRELLLEKSLPVRRGVLRGPGVGCLKKIQTTYSGVEKGLRRGLSIVVPVSGSGEFSFPAPNAGGRVRFHTKRSDRTSPAWVLPAEHDLASSRVIQVETALTSSLCGLILGGDGLPLHGLQLQINAAEATGNEDTAPSWSTFVYAGAGSDPETDIHGRFSAGPGLPGIWTLSIRGRAGRELLKEVKVEVQPGTTAEVTVRLE